MIRLISISALILAAVGPAWSQVQISQTGRQLDSNYMIGGRGFNAPSAIVPESAYSSNLYITGQITGGQSFRGRTFSYGGFQYSSIPYAASDQLRLTLPSQTLDDFTRDSVGLQRIVSGRTYQPQPYTSPYRQTITSADVSRNLNLPGRNTIREYAERQDLTEQLYESTMQAYVPLSSRIRSDLRVDIPSQPEAETPAWAVRLGQASRVESSLLFGAIESEDEAVALQQMLLEGRLMRQQQAQQPLEALQVDPNAPPLISGSQVVDPSDPNDDYARYREMIEQQQGIVENEDVYLDLMRKLEQRMMPRNIARMPSSAPATQPGSGVAVLEAPPDQPLLVEQTDGELVIRALGGNRRDLSNVQLRRADELLAEGRYYDAAALYETAMTYHPSNPLPALGSGLSYFAAGEFLRAGQRIAAALRMFPPQMEARVDLAGMTDGDVVNARLAELAEGVESGDIAAGTDTLLVLTWVNQNLGREDAARRWARQLQANVPEESILSTYVTYVLTGERPTPPATESDSAGEAGSENDLQQ